MTTPHKATPADWAWLEGSSTVDRYDAAWSRGLIELRARVEALEADGPAVPSREPASVAMQPTPTSSLVERVADAMAGAGVQPMSQPLSPAAQIMIAVTHIYQEHGGNPPARAVTAAALRAAADQVSGWESRNELRAIAAELGGQR